MQPSDETIALAGFTLDLAQSLLRDPAGAEVRLRPRAMNVLQFLARHAGRVVTKDELMNAVWAGTVVTDDSLVQCIKEIRLALNDDGHRIVRTSHRRGYQLMPPRGASDKKGSSGDETNFTQDIRFATAADGVRIAYAISGSGPPLVRAEHWMTHLDWDWRSATFGARIRALSQRYRLVRYDGRGSGLSDWDAAPGPLDVCVSDLEAVIDSAGLDRFALLGASGGAPVAIRYAAHHPQRVTGLVLLGGFARGALRRGAGSTNVDNFNAILRLIEDGWAQDNPAFRQLMTSLFWPGANAQEMQSFNNLQRVSCTPQTAVARLRRNADFDATDDLPAVRCPTLVMHSPRDSRVPFEEGRRVAAAIPGERLEPFDSPNHTPLVDEPAFGHVLALIDAFMAEAGSVDCLPARSEASRPALHAVDEGHSGDAEAAPAHRNSPVSKQP